MLHSQDRYRIQRRLEPVKRQVAAGTKVDHQLAQIFAVLNQSANGGRMGQRPGRFAYGVD